MLRKNLPFTGPDSPLCNATCVASAWTGDAAILDELWSGCSLNYTFGALGPGSSGLLYHTCNNEGGLNIDVDDGGACFITPGGVSSGVDLYVDRGPRWEVAAFPAPVRPD